MDTPGKRKKRDHQKIRASERRYRELKNAVVDDIEQVRAHNRQRYYKRIDSLKVTRQYEALKQHKCVEGKRRYHTMSAEQRNEVRRKNLILQKAWRNKMIQEGTYGEYRQPLNARRREQLAQKKRAMGAKGWKEHQKALYARRAESELRKRWNWLEE